MSRHGFTNSTLPNLVRNGKIYLSLSDAITLALENNYDIAIARYNLDIADTDILLSKAGAATARRKRGYCRRARWAARASPCSSPVVDRAERRSVPAVPVQAPAAWC